MKKINELLSKRAVLIQEMDEMVKTEKMTEEQTRSYDELSKEVENLTKEISRAQKQEEYNKLIAGSVTIKEEKTDEQKRAYDIGKAIREYLTGGLTAVTGVEKEMHERMAEVWSKNGQTLRGLGIPTSELRADPLLSTTQTGIINKTVDTNVSIMKSPAENLVRQMGVTIYEGLNGNFVLPSQAQVTGGFVSETTAVGSAGLAPAALTLSARRCGVRQQFTRELLNQTSPQVYAQLVQDLNDSIWRAVVADLFDNLKIDAVDASTTTTDAGLTYADVVKLESNVPYEMVSPGYVTTPAIRAYLKNANAGSAGIKFIWGDDNVVNTYPAFASALQNTNVLAFGDWKKAVIGSYGSGIELLYDPYTLAAEGEIKVIASGLFDTGISNYRAFSWADDVSAGL